MRQKILVLLIISIVSVTAFVLFRHTPARRPFGQNNSNPSLNSLADFFNHKIPFNVLLLGYGGGDHDGAYLTDSMMLAQVDPEKKTASLISIPRDIWVKIPTNGKEGGYWKVNAAYALGMDNGSYPNKDEVFKGKEGPGNMAKFAVGQITGLSIDRFLALDFNGFKKTIDTLGGIDVKVEKTFDDYEYPIDGRENDLCGRKPEELPDLEKEATVSATNAFPCRFEHLHFDAGVIHMDGATALKFVRSRHSLQDGSDFGRSIRQKNVILATKNKVLSLDFISKIPGFVKALSGSYSTDLDPSDIASLLGQASVASSYEIKSLALTTDNFLQASFSADGQYVLIPKAGLDNWDELHHGLQSFLDPKTRTSFPVVRVESGSGKPGLVPLAATGLRVAGFVIFTSQSNSIVSKPGQILEKTKIVLNNEQVNQKLVRKIQNILGTGEVSVNQTGDTSFDILVTLGLDFLPKTISP